MHYIFTNKGHITDVRKSRRSKGFNAEKEGRQQILEGIVEVPDKTLKYMAMVIDRLRIPQVVKKKDQISNIITITEHIQG